MLDRRARQAPRDLIELLDRGPDLGERHDRLLLGRRLGLYLCHRSSRPPSKLRLDQLSEIGRDRDPPRQRRLAEGDPGLIVDRDPGDLGLNE